MEQYIKSLSHKTEFLFIILIAFGYPILTSFLSLVATRAEPAISQSTLQLLLVYEPLIIVALGGMLLLRGWRPVHIGLSLNVKDIVAGGALALAAYAAFFALYMACHTVIPQALKGNDALVMPGLAMGTVLVVSVVNPLFEELFVCGYVISALKKSHSDFYAINISIVIRLAYHLYQGANGVVGMIPLGFVFAFWYARTSRLWPVIIAHALFDFIALQPYISS
jgi:membrane protease YdiL (CAAX protease family)